jgi:RNA polymerase sigma-70 factor (TIGR02957 family)
MMEVQFDQLRPKGFAIAYRMLGSVSEAEEVVQEASLRLYREFEEGAEIESPEAYFVTVVTRLAIDELRSARARREVYTGEWLPEPIVTAEDEDPARHAEIADSLSLGLLVVLETLTPEERAVFLLREVFDYPHDRIAEVLGKSPAAVRQLAVRARGHVGEREPRFETSREQHDRLAASFFDAFEQGDLEKLESLLAADVSLHGDGGGKAPAIAKAMWGRVRVAQMLVKFSNAGERIGGFEVRLTELNGGLGALSYGPEGKLISALVVETDGGEIKTINSIVNPDKLAHLGPVADVKALLKRRRQT